MKCRQKPIEIEAVRFTRDNWVEISKFTSGKAGCFVIPDSPYKKCECDISTSRGTLTALEGDYIIKGMGEECYPCKPDIFVQMYEAPVEGVEA